MLHRDHNDGLPFGILRQKKELVKQLPLAVVSAVAGIFAWIYPKKGNMPEKIGLALVIGGGLSNLYDRMTRGYVVDYVSFNVPFRLPGYFQGESAGWEELQNI